MPSKGARGTARASTRGSRGRGQRVIEQDAETIQESHPATSAQTHSTPATTTPGESNDIMPQSPNSSPVTVPTETPAPTPIRAPPTSDPSSSSRATLFEAPSFAIRGRGNAASSRFKPRNVRRDQSERDRLAEEERARLAMQNAIFDREKEQEMRRRLRLMPRTRGSVMGMVNNREQEKEKLLASGPFAKSAPSGIRPAAYGYGLERGAGSSTWGEGSGVGGGGGGELGGDADVKVKTEAGSAGSAGSAVGKGRIPRSVGERKGAVSFHDPDQFRDEEDLGPRIPVEQINVVPDDLLHMISSEKEQVDSDKGGLRPMRAPRREYIPVSAKHRSGGKKLKSEESEDDSKVNKDETEIDGDQTAILQSPAPDDHGITNTAGVSDQQTKAPKLRRHTEQVKETFFQTPQEKAEYERHNEDLRVLKNELANIRVGSEDAQGDVDMTGDGNQGIDKKEGRLYLFQFPPSLPPLVNPEAESRKTKGKGKANDEEVEMTGESIDLTASNKPVKLEDDITIKIEPGEGKDTPSDESYVREEGYIGKMVVRESGRVELDWGGTHMLLSRGAAETFPSCVVIAEDSGAEGECHGTATGMGKVFGRFVITPDWERLF